MPEIELPEDTHALKVLAGKLMRELAEREQQVAVGGQRIRELEVHNEKLKFELARFQRWKFGKTSESVGADQIALWEGGFAADIEALQARLEKAQDEIGPNTGSKPKGQPRREALPASLPRLEERLEPEDTVCGCGQAMTRIGEDVAETLQIVPSRFWVKRTVRGKWACRCCQKLEMAPVPAVAIDKGIAGASVLANVIVAKYVDHLPLYRQETIYARLGVPIARSTMAGWIGRLSVLLEPLTDLLAEHVVRASAVQADETPMSVLQPGAGKTSTGYLWACRTLPSDAVQAVTFDFAMSRAQQHANRLLANFQGTLQVDGYAGYNDVLRRPGMIEAGCWAHARRKFVEVFEDTKSPVAQQAITRIAALYGIEDDLKEATAPQRERERRTRAAPLLEALHEWLLATRTKLPPRSALAKAMQYTLNRWKALTRYVDDGRLPLDTNAIENAIRPIALGKKNYLFAGSQSGGQRAAQMYSLLITCKLNEVEPLAYLTDVLQRLPTAKARDLEAMLPWNWKPMPGIDAVTALAAAPPPLELTA